MAQFQDAPSADDDSPALLPAFAVGAHPKESAAQHLSIRSGPIATIIQDILSLVIYFAIASFLVGT